MNRGYILPVLLLVLVLPLYVSVSLSEDVPEMINPTGIPTIYCHPWVYSKGSIYTIDGKLVATNIPYTDKYYCFPNNYLLLLLPGETIYVDRSGAHVYNVYPEVFDPLTGLLVVSKKNNTYMVIYPGTGSVIPFSTTGNYSRIVSVSMVADHPLVLVYSRIGNYTRESIIVDALTKKSVSFTNMTPLLLIGNRLFLEDRNLIIHVYTVRINGMEMNIEETKKIDAGIKLMKGEFINGLIVFIDQDGYVYVLYNNDLRLVGRGSITAYGVVTGSSTMTWDGKSVPGTIRYRCGDVYVTSRGLYSDDMVKINVTDTVRIKVKVCGFVGEATLSPGLYVVPRGTIIIYNGKVMRVERDMVIPGGVEKTGSSLRIKLIGIVNLSVPPVKTYRGVVSVGYGYGKVGIVLPDRVVVITPGSMYYIIGSYRYYIPGPGVIDAVGDIGALTVTRNGEPFGTIDFNPGGRGIPVHGVIRPTETGYEVIYVDNSGVFHLYSKGIDNIIDKYYESPDNYMYIETQQYHGVETVVHTPYGLAYLPGKGNISGTILWTQIRNVVYVIDSSTGNDLQIVLPEKSEWIPVTITKGVLVTKKGNETYAYLYDLGPVLHGSYVDIYTVPFNSTIIVNGAVMGIGHVRIYGYVGDKYDIKVIKEWYYPNETEVTIKRNPYEVTITLKKMMSNLIVRVEDLPVNETAVVSIDGVTYSTHGSIKTTVSMGERHVIELIDDKPFHICYKTRTEIVPTKPETHIILKCKPRAGVLVIKSLYNDTIPVDILKKTGKGEALVTHLSIKPLGERTVYLVNGEYVVKGPDNQSITIYIELGKIVRIYLKPAAKKPVQKNTLVVVTGTKGALVVIYKDKSVIARKTIPFNITLDPGNYTLIASKIGYKPKTLKLEITGKERIKKVKIVLEPRPIITNEKEGKSNQGFMGKMVSVAVSYKYYILIGTLLLVGVIIYIRQRRR